MGMTVIAAERLPDQLRGRLRNYLIEISAGVYVGRINRRLRETLIEWCANHPTGGPVIFIWQTNTESGFNYESLGANGQRRQIIQLDGLPLTALRPLVDK